MTEVLIPVLAFVSVIAFVGGLVALIAHRRRAPASRMPKRDSRTHVAAAPGVSAALVMHRVGAAVSAKRISKRLRQNMARAGFYNEAAASVYLGIKLSLLVAALGGFSVVGAALEVPLTVALPLIAGGGTIMFFLPNLFLYVRGRKRTTQIRRHLPDAVDLIEVCVSSGMSLDAAWNSVGDEIRQVSPTLSDEMALTNLEINMGLQRAAAMRNMAGRTGANDLESLVALLVQAERFGTSIADALREFANSLRETRRQRAEEAAEKMPVKLLFPMVLCLFPVMMIVLVGPAGINLAKVMSAP